MTTIAAPGNLVTARVLRPPTRGPCSASPTHRSFGAGTSNRPNTAGCSPAGGPISSRRWNSRSSVDSDGGE